MKGINHCFSLLHGLTLGFECNCPVPGATGAPKSILLLW